MPEAKSLSRFTDVNGKPITLDPADISYIGAPHSQGAGATIHLKTGSNLHVAESAADLHELFANQLAAPRTSGSSRQKPQSGNETT